jgi:hypothetical protein
MSHHIIDRRKNQRGKSSANRQRFLRRVKDSVRDAARDAIRDGSIKDIADGKKKKINIPARDLKEYQIVHGQGGERQIVHPGNKDFVPGDRIARPKSGGQGGREGSKDGDGEDSFEFELTNEEFQQYFFEDLELPDLVKRSIKAMETFEMNRAGFVKEGTPARLNIERSMRRAKGRRTALRGPKKRKIRELEAELEDLNNTIEHMQANGQDCTIEKDRRDEVIKQLEALKRKVKAIPYVDTMDLQYNHWVKNPIPVTQAVMFCLMDVSGSMGEWEKEMAKRFYMLLYLFLTRSYERVEVVFIRHHSVAKEVDEQEFFYSRETGGTVVSSSLDLMKEIVKDRYDLTTWNIYACQASDGDNWRDDNARVEDLMVSSILPMVQYYAYVEINKHDGESDLHQLYESLRTKYSHFNTAHIADAADIYPVFRGLFEKDKKDSK